MQHCPRLFGNLHTTWKYNYHIGDSSFIGKTKNLELSVSEGRGCGHPEHLESLRKFQMSYSLPIPTEIGICIILVQLPQLIRMLAGGYG